MTIEEAVKILAHRNEHLYALTGKVKSVDVNKRTCEVLPVNEDSMLVDVRLQAIESGNTGILIVPEENSDVIVGFLSRNDAFVLHIQEIKNIIISVGYSQMEITENNIVLNGGNLGGLVKVASLIQKLNALENDINILKTVITAWTPVSGDGGAALKTAVAGWAGQTITLTTQNDLENPKIKHG